MSKKAQAIMETIEMLWKLAIVAIIAVYLIIVIFYYLNETIDTDSTQISVLNRQIIYSPDCLAYQDDFKIYPGIIDLSKWNTESLRKCRTRDDYGIRLTLKDMNSHQIKEQMNLMNLEKQKLLAVCESLADYKCYKKTTFINYVTIQDNKLIRAPAILEMEVIKHVED